jgi:hypothetical protein
MDDNADQQYRSERGTGATADPYRYRDAAVIYGINNGGPAAGLAVAAAGFGKTGAAIACGSIAAGIGYALGIHEYRDDDEDVDPDEPDSAYTVSADADTAVDDAGSRVRPVLEALDEFGVLKEELSPAQQEKYRDTIQVIRDDD